MNSIRVFSQRIIYTVAVVALLLSLIIPMVVSAATVTARSIQVSSAAKEAENVSYTVQFTAAGGAGAFVVDFCDNTPLLGQTCDAPADFSAAAATVNAAHSTDYTINAATTANRLVVDTTITASEVVTVQFDGIDNPSAAGPLYARIVTFDTPTNAAAASPTNLANSVDEGAVVISITEAFSVSGTVLETLTFCVSGTAITDLCETVTAPTLELGETTSSVTALQAGTVSEGSIYTQISTNAVGGAVVRLKSGAEGCGGLMRAGAPTACDIAPAQQLGIDGSAALFGVRTTTAVGLAGESFNGQLVPYSGSGYNNTTYALNFDDPNEETGVTSTFGDPFLSTGDAPVNAMGMELEFAATITNETPAGTYSADLSLIAVGKF